MKLTKERATFEAFCKRFGMDPTLKVSEWQSSFQQRLCGWNAATERMQDEIAKLLEAVDELTVMNKAKAEAIEEHAQSIFSNENAKLLEVIGVAKKYVDSFDGRTVGGRTHDFLREFRLVYGVHGIDEKAGLDQREAKGDGDEKDLP